MLGLGFNTRVVRFLPIAENVVAKRGKYKLRLPVGEKVNITPVLFEMLKKSSLTERKRIIKSCFAKKRFKHMGEVCDALSYIYKKQDKNMNFYNCKYCRGYHITKDKKRKK